MLDVVMTPRVLSEMKDNGNQDGGNLPLSAVFTIKTHFHPKKTLQAIEVCFLGTWFYGQMPAEGAVVIKVTSMVRKVQLECLPQSFVVPCGIFSKPWLCQCS